MTPLKQKIKTEGKLLSFILEGNGDLGFAQIYTKFENSECFLKFPSYLRVELNCLTNLIFKRATHFIGKVRLKVEKWDYFRSIFWGQEKNAIEKFMSVSGF